MRVSASGCDFKELGDLISGIESDGRSIPVLLRLYFQLGGQLRGFNVDHKFGNRLDGVIMDGLKAPYRRLLER